MKFKVGDRVKWILLGNGGYGVIIKIMEFSDFESPLVQIREKMVSDRDDQFSGERWLLREDDIELDAPQAVRYILE